MKIIRYIFIILLSSSQCVVCYSQTWNALGIGANSAVGGSGSLGDALQVFNNKLYLGGPYVICGLQVNGVASFDGLKFDSLDGGLNGEARCFAIHNNKLYAVGHFVSAGGVANSACVAEWDGNTWLSAGNNYYNLLYSTASYKGDLYVGGNFNQIGGKTVNRIAKWNGSAWSGLGTGLGGSVTSAYSMAVYNGKLYVGGEFQTAGSKPAWYIARWNGTQWDTVGPGLNGAAFAMLVDTVKNVLYVGGGFTGAGGKIALGVAMWNDTTWTSMASITDTLWGTKSLCIYNGELYAGGGNSTITAQGDTLNNIYKLVGTKWKSPIGGGVDGAVSSMKVFNGNLYVGGDFKKAGTTGYLSSGGGIVSANYIACYGNTCPVGVGVHELQTQSLEFKIFPNPTKEELNILIDKKGNAEYVLRIYNSAGNKILERKILKQTNINTSIFSKGIYQVQVCDGGGKYCHTEKVVIQ